MPVPHRGRQTKKQTQNKTMSKHTITHSCGHTHEYQLYGKSDERTRKIKWLETQECPACQKAAEAAEAAKKAEEEAAAAKINEELNLPVLSGSEKQIAWANCIRARLIAAARVYNDSSSRKIIVDKAIELIASVNSAHTFIDNRNLDVFSFLVTIASKKA